MDQHRLDRAVGHRLPERREVIVAVGGRPPHPRRLVEDLDRVRAERSTRARPPWAALPPGRRVRRLASEIHESSFRSFTDRRAAHRRRAHRVVQLAAGARPRGRAPGPCRHARAADRRYRPRALDAGERRADLRRAALAEPRLGRGPDLPDRARGAPPAGAGATAGRRPRVPLHRDRRRRQGVQGRHGADRGFRGEPRGRRGRPPARPRRGTDGRPRCDPRRHARSPTPASTTR